MADARERRGCELLRTIELFVARFVVLPKGALLPLALWIIGTFVFDTFETFPYLALLSPEKGCGKTRATEVLELLAANPVRAVSLSEAAMFRLIQSQMPTLILDEAEVLVGKGERAEAIRALLNAGNRTGAQVARCVGQSHALQFFSVYCPKVICAIRACPETVRDRSIVIPMQRKRPGESVARFILRRVRPEGHELRERIKTFSDVNRVPITEAYEGCAVEFLTDRDSENWEPLVAICTVSDPSRLPELRASAESLTQEKKAVGEDESLSLRLLLDLRSVWPEGQSNAFTSDLIYRLATVEDAPWREEMPLNPRKLARMLRPFGVTPNDVRVGSDKAKGYRRLDLEAAFERYLTPERRQGDRCDEPAASPQRQE